MDLRYLKENYVPDEIFFRDKQINEIKTNLELYKKFGKGINLLITGRTGSGKTATLKYITNQYNGFCSYVSISENNKKSNYIIRSLSGLNYKQNHNLMAYFLKDLNKEPKALIIDEVDRCEDFNELMDTLNSIYRMTQIPIILLTNNLNFLRLLREDVRKTLNFEIITFNPYEVPELYQILDDRLKLCEIEIENDKKTIIAAISANYGSSRLLLDIAYNCIIKDNFNAEFIKDKIKEFESEELKEYILKNINMTERRVLREILVIEGFNKSNPNEIIEINSGILFKRLSISRARLSQILDNLERLGVIQTKEIRNLGRKIGKVRVLKIDEYEYGLLKDCGEI